MTTFMLVHGKWHDASCWEPVTRALEARGHDVIAHDIPQDDPAVGYRERLAAFTAHDTSAAVVVAHSLGASYAQLIPAARRVYLCPAPRGPLAGVADDPVRPGFPFPPDEPDGTSAWDLEAA